MVLASLHGRDYEAPDIGVGVNKNPTSGGVLGARRLYHTPIHPTSGFWPVTLKTSKLTVHKPSGICFVEQSLGYDPTKKSPIAIVRWGT